MAGTQRRCPWGEDHDVLGDSKPHDPYAAPALLGLLTVISRADELRTLSIAAIELSDNGDDDGFADSNETVSMRLVLRNNTGLHLTGLRGLLTTNSARIECITQPIVEIGTFPILTELPIDFEFKVAAVERTTVGEEFDAEFMISFSSPQGGAIQTSFTVDLDLDVSGGAGPLAFFEGFESGDLGQFTVTNVNWQTTTERAFSGFHSLYFGIPLDPELGFTTPLDQESGASTIVPINLGWADVCSETRSQNCSSDGDCPVGESCVAANPRLSFKHQVSFVDARTLNTDAAFDTAVVRARECDVGIPGACQGVAIEPFQNVHHIAGEFTGTPAFSFIGNTDLPFDSLNVGGCGPDTHGPGLEGSEGPGTWIESIYDLGRFRGRQVFLEFFETSAPVGGGSSTWDNLLFLFNPDPGDDGWWIDDVRVVDALATPATMAVDLNDNGGLPGLADNDGDGVFCDNCPNTANPGQADGDGDLVGDACDACPLEFFNDQDGDGLCCPDDNCCTTSNPSQSDQDVDAVGDLCDNCLLIPNNDQLDTDGDLHGDACDSCPFDPANDIDNDGICADMDNCPSASNSLQLDTDADSFGDVCDNCPAASNAIQDDADADGIGDVCDNCPDLANSAQVDGNNDGEGDVCDFNDNLIYTVMADKDTVSWQFEMPFISWNMYRGDLAVLKNTEIYTQAVGLSPLVAQFCNIGPNSQNDTYVPPTGSTVFYLVTGRTVTGVERPLGTDSSGNQRPNTNPCP